MADRPLRFGVVYDFRNPPDSGIATPALSVFIAQHGITDLVTWAVPPGLRPEQMNASLDRFARGVAPRLRATAASRATGIPTRGA